jgi:hypothetical protein
MARRAQTWVVDPRHYLSEETEDLAEMPGPALNCAMFFSSIVAWATDHAPAGDPHTNVWRGDRGGSGAGVRSWPNFGPTRQKSYGIARGAERMG